MSVTAKLPLMRRSIDSQQTSRRSNFSLTPLSSGRRTKEHPIKFLRPGVDNRNGSMEAYTGSVGNEAKMEFFDTYMNLPQFSQRNQHQKLEDSPNLAYLGAVERRKLKPAPFGIVRRKGPETLIDIHQYSMGDAYAVALAEGIKHFKNVATLNLKGNRLTDNGAAQILNTLESKKVKRIILSENRISINTVNSLTNIIKSQETTLKVLELENTRITEKALSILCRLLSEDKRLIRLSLAKNSLGEASVPALVEMLRYNQTLKYLDLHWNCLGIASASQFLDALASNDGLVHIDLSYNSFGRKDGLVTAKALASMLSRNQFLQHVDLSNNYLSRKECEVVGEGLKDNHTIFGIHMQGNDCYVDSKGYVIPLDYLNKTEVGHLHRRLLDTPRYKPKSFSHMNCWICENWVEVTITWKPKISGSLCEAPIFIHLECDNYQQTKMSDTEPNLFMSTRMVPPGMLKFFFSDSSSIEISGEYNSHVVDSPIKIEYPSAEGKKHYISVTKTNVIVIEAEQWDYNNPHGVPRNDPRIKERTEMVIERVQWAIENSVFKDYQFDTEEHLAECLDYDIEVSNMKEILQDKKEQAEIIAMLKDNYKLIAETFRQLSAISGIELFSIGKNVLAEFLKKCSFENEELVLQESGIVWNLSNAPQSKGEKYNAGNGLCRYEFAEFLVRLALSIFYKTKKCSTIKESFLKLLNEHAIPGMKKYDQSHWHTEKYLKEDIDHFFRFHRPVLQAIFDKYAAMGKGALDKMNLHEFRMLCNDAGLCNKDFVMREIDMCFRQAMMTEVDEILHSEHLQMVYVEFIEALARIAEQIYVDKPGEVIPLKKKLDLLMPSLMAVCPQKVKSAFEFPTDSHYHNMKYQKKLITIQEYIAPK